MKDQVTSHVEQVLMGYKEQYNCYQEMLNEALDRGDLIAAGKTDGLNAEARHIHNINEINKTLKFHMDAVCNLINTDNFELAKIKPYIPADLLDALQQQVNLIRAQIEKLIELNWLRQESIGTEIREIQKELQKIHTHHELQQAYLDRPEMFPEPQIVDKKE